MKTYEITEPKQHPAYVANGLIGLRVPAVPLAAGRALVNGYWGLQEKGETECYEPAPYPLGLGIALGGHWFSGPDAEGVELVSQSYDFSRGELLTCLHLSSGAGSARVDVLTFASRSWPTAVCQQVTVVPDTDLQLTIQNVIEFQGLPGRVTQSKTPRVDCCDFQLLHQARGGLSCLGVAVHSEFCGGDLQQELRTDWAYDRPMPAKEFRVAARAGQSYRTRTVATMVPQLMHGEPHHQAGRLCNLALRRGFDGLRQQNRRVWADLWRGRVHIRGADETLQDIADACFFYVHSSVHASTPCSLAPFALSGTPLYRGGVFWDCESYAYPVALLTQPPAARACRLSLPPSATSPLECPDAGRRRRPISLDERLPRRRHVRGLGHTHGTCDPECVRRLRVRPIRALLRR